MQIRCKAQLCMLVLCPVYYVLQAKTLAPEFIFYTTRQSSDLQACSFTNTSYPTENILYIPD